MTGAGKGWNGGGGVLGQELETVYGGVLQFISVIPKGFPIM